MVNHGAFGLELGEQAQGAGIGAIPTEGHDLETERFDGIGIVLGSQSRGAFVVQVCDGEELAGRFFEAA